MVTKSVKHSIIVLFQITFRKIGVKEYSGFIEGFGPVLTLSDAVESMGDKGKTISYLKVRPQAAYNNVIGLLI